MKSLEVFQHFMKIFRVVLIILTFLVMGITIFYGLSLAAWISFDVISYASKNEIYKFILQFTDVGPYYYNVVFAAGKFAFSAINVTLIAHLYILINKVIRVGTPFTMECASSVKWLGIRFFIFPIVALCFSSFIYYYLNQGFPFEFINLSYFCYGFLFIISSFLLEYGYEIGKDKSPNKEEILN